MCFSRSPEQFWSRDLRRLTVDAFDAFHLLQQARRQAERLFAEYDALLLPTAPFCPTLAEVAADPFGPNRRLGTFTNFANLCDMAAFAVPIGRPAIGGVLLGPAWSEGRLAPLADSLHRQFATTVGATGQRLPPPAEPNPLEANETALFCIGAHMSGLPLNWQITTVGGRFLREAQTKSEYRLFVLGNRPGMVRAADGAAIAGEVWALPTTAIGVLLAQVPPPLGFGTVTLDDGPCLGFLAESAGVGDATEITHLGGWRAWLRSNLGIDDGRSRFGRLDRCRNRGSWDQNESGVEARGAHASGDLPRSCCNRSADAAR